MTKKVFTIGIVVLLGITIFIFILFYMNQIRMAQSGNYVLVKFNSTDGLKVNDEVRFRGVKCGMVDAIVLTDDFVLVRLWFDKRVKVPDKSFIALKDCGIIGGTKYIFLQPAGDSLYRYPKDTLIGEKHDFDIDQVGTILRDIKEVIEKSIPEKEKIDAITDTIFSALNKINSILLQNDAEIGRTVSDITYASNKVKMIVDSLYPAINLIKKEIEEFSGGSGSVKRILREDTVYVKLNKSLEQLNELLDKMKKNKLIKGCL